MKLQNSRDIHPPVKTGIDGAIYPYTIRENAEILPVPIEKLHELYPRFYLFREPHRGNTLSLNLD